MNTNNQSLLLGQSFSKQSSPFLIGGHTITPKGSGFSISDGTYATDVSSYRSSCGAGKWKYQGLFGQLKINGQIFVDDDKIVKV